MGYVASSEPFYILLQLWIFNFSPEALQLLENDLERVKGVEHAALIGKKLGPRFEYNIHCIYNHFKQIISHREFFDLPPFYV